jgi:hypothetical protein
MPATVPATVPLAALPATLRVRAAGPAENVQDTVSKAWLLVCFLLALQGLSRVPAATHLKAATDT